MIREAAGPPVPRLGLDGDAEGRHLLHDGPGPGRCLRTKGRTGAGGDEEERRQHRPPAPAAGFSLDTRGAAE